MSKITKIRHTLHRMEATNKAQVLGSVVACALIIWFIKYVTGENNFITFEATKSTIFSIDIALCYIGFCNTACMFSNQKQFIMHRMRSGICTPFEYLAAISLSQILLCSLQAVVATFIYSTLDYANKGLIFQEVNFDIFVTFFLVTYSSTQLGLFIGILMNSPRACIITIPIVMISQMMLSNGIFTLKEESILDLASKYMSSRYGMAAIGSILDINQYPVALQLEYPMIVQPPNAFFSFDTEYVFECWEHMALISVIFFIMAYLTIEFLVRKKEG